MSWEEMSVCHTVGATMEVVVWVQRYEEVDIFLVQVPLVLVDHLWPASVSCMVYRSCQESAHVGRVGLRSRCPPCAVSVAAHKFAWLVISGWMVASTSVGDLADQCRSVFGVYT